MVGLKTELMFIVTGLCNFAGHASHRSDGRPCSIDPQSVNTHNVCR